MSLTRMNGYQAKQEARLPRLEAAAERGEARAVGAFDRAGLPEDKSGIPFGQLILIGHLREGRHRRAISRANAAMEKGVAESKRVEGLPASAAGVRVVGISSDDPDALAKMQAKLDRLTEKQRLMVGSDQRGMGCFPCRSASDEADLYGEHHPQLADA